MGHLALAQVRSLKKARDVKDQILGLFERTEVELTSNPQDTRAIRKAITSGYFYHTALLQRSGNYRTLKKPQVMEGDEVVAGGWNRPYCEMCDFVGYGVCMACLVLLHCVA
jgi:hypothetical protein